MKDLPNLRQQLTDNIRPLDGSEILIPIPLKRRLCDRWEKAIEPVAGGIRLSTQKGDEHFTDNDLLKAILAHDLTQELQSYKAKLKEFTTQHSITQEALKQLKATTTPENTPTWWPPVEESIRANEDLSEEEKDKLIRFSTDNEWSGCTKGAGRDDFFTSSVVNACLSNVTHNAILGKVAKDLLELRAEVDPILQWHQGITPEVNFSHEHLEKFTSQLPKDPRAQLLCSLVSKQFCILTGASGTGKTRLARSITEYFGNASQSNSATVAVGADWTDNRSVLGFVNHLRSVEKNGVALPVYQSTQILDLILKACDDADTPYFLILDEMNLSHVERYFADFLSAMEQDEGVLELHKEGELNLPRHDTDELGVPHQIVYPSNLFVIGTVNIDETTYMFSPKVLDRANVIEFTVSPSDIGTFLSEPTTYPATEPAVPGVSQGFLGLAQKARNLELDPLPESCVACINGHLVKLFDILQNERFEFAFRTAKEINAYLRACNHLSQNKINWGRTEPLSKEEIEEGKSNCLSDLDDQVLQKLLPKLHGSMGRIGRLLAELASYCHSGEVKEGGIQLKDAAKLEADENTPLPKSLVKLQSMIRTLLDEQFVSFIQ